MDKDKLAIGDIIVVEEDGNPPSVWNGYVFGEEYGYPLIKRWIKTGNGMIILEEDPVLADENMMDRIAEAWRQNPTLRTRDTRTLTSIVVIMYKIQSDKKTPLSKFMSDLKMYRVDIDWEPN